MASQPAQRTLGTEDLTRIVDIQLHRLNQRLADLAGDEAVVFDVNADASGLEVVEAARVA